MLSSFLPSTVCISRVTTRNSDFQQLAKTRNQIQTSGRLTTKTDPQFQKAKAQYSVLISGLHRQGYREVKLYVILVGAMGTIFTNTIQTNLWQTSIRIAIRLKSWHKLNEHSIRHAAALIKTRFALQYNTSNNSQGLDLGATAHNPPDPH